MLFSLQANCTNLARVNSRNSKTAIKVYFNEPVLIQKSVKE